MTIRVAQHPALHAAGYLPRLGDVHSTSDSRIVTAPPARPDPQSPPPPRPDRCTLSSVTPRHKPHSRLGTALAALPPLANSP